MLIPHTRTRGPFLVEWLLRHMVYPWLRWPTVRGYVRGVPAGWLDLPANRYLGAPFPLLKLVHRPERGGIGFLAWLQAVAPAEQAPGSAFIPARNPGTPYYQPLLTFEKRLLHFVVRLNFFRRGNLELLFAHSRPGYTRFFWAPYN